jgi:hypothetical protein
MQTHPFSLHHAALYLTCNPLMSPTIELGPPPSPFSFGSRMTLLLLPPFYCTRTRDPTSIDAHCTSISLPEILQDPPSHCTTLQALVVTTHAATGTHTLTSSSTRAGACGRPWRAKENGCISWACATPLPPLPLHDTDPATPLSFRRTVGRPTGLDRAWRFPHTPDAQFPPKPFSTTPLCQ